MRKLLLLFLIAGLGIGLFSLFSAPAATEDLRILSQGGARHFSVEIAQNPQQQRTGLMRRTSLAPDHGMLFIQKRETNMAMWMKNTLIPLDMLFIDARGQIVYITHNAQPESLTANSAHQPVLAVLEIAGGQAQNQGIAVGDKVEHRFFAP